VKQWSQLLLHTVSNVACVSAFDESSCSFTDEELTSKPLDRAVEHNLAELMQCSIHVCNGLPNEPIITSCNHIYCKPCIMSGLHIAMSVSCVLVSNRH
jgi:hypothetical protein